ncbi:MAG: hypothetical protein HN590_00695, partial [Calditrichaeota bacterium]|nr:hypothetical protein [Calditrichota bacterium]
MRHMLIMFTIIVLFSSTGLFAQDAENIEEISTLTSRWDGGSDVAIIDNYAYVTSGETGLQILDISDPEHPTLAGCYTDTMGSMNSIIISGDYAYIGYANTWDRPSYLSVLDMSNRLTPEQISSRIFGGPLRNIHLLDDQLYISSRLVGEENIHCLAIIDISNRQDPVTLGEWESEGFINHFFVVNDEVYIARENDLVVLDISDLDNISIAYRYEQMGGTRLFVNNNTIYIIYDSILQIIDVSDPEEPQRVGESQVPGACSTTHYELIVSANFAYVSTRGSYCEGGGFSCFSVTDVSNPAEPELVGRLDLPQTPQCFIIIDERVIAAERGGLRIFRISDRNSPETLGHFSTAGSMTWIYSQGDFTYIIANFEGEKEPDINMLRIFDTSEPDAPMLVNIVEIYGRSAQVFDNRLYNYDQGIYFSQSFSVYDLSNLENIERIYNLPVYQPGTIYPIFIEEPFFYLAQERVLRIFDISDPDTLLQVGAYNNHWDQGRGTKDILVQEGIIYLT